MAIDRRRFVDHAIGLGWDHDRIQSSLKRYEAKRPSIQKPQQPQTSTTQDIEGLQNIKRLLSGNVLGAKAYAAQPTSPQQQQRLERFKAERQPAPTTEGGKYTLIQDYLSKLPRKNLRPDFERRAFEQGEKLDPYKNTVDWGKATKEDHGLMKISSISNLLLDPLVQGYMGGGQRASLLVKPIVQGDYDSKGLLELLQMLVGATKDMTSRSGLQQTQEPSVREVEGRVSSRQGDIRDEQLKILEDLVYKI